jgi:2-hydroxychromene-2-carboxylate isomerase
MALTVTCFTDPACPWAYSASPAFAVLRWRYAEQLQWRLVTIGLTENAEQYVQRGYTPARSARGNLRFRERYGMPFASEPRARVVATARACRALQGARIISPGSEWEAYRALQFAWFTTTLLPDDDGDIQRALEQHPVAIDAAAVVDKLGDAEVGAAYQADRAETRTAEGGPTHFQGKAAATDGPVRFTAPSLIFGDGERRLEAGGFQPVEAYDVLIANLDPTLERREPPEDPFDALGAFPGGLTTQEVAAIMAQGNDAPDRRAAEEALVGLVGDGRARRLPRGNDALWLAAA